MFAGYGINGKLLGSAGAGELQTAVLEGFYPSPN